MKKKVKLGTIKLLKHNNSYENIYEKNEDHTSIIIETRKNKIFLCHILQPNISDSYPLNVISYIKVCSV